MRLITKAHYLANTALLLIEDGSLIGGHLMEVQLSLRYKPAVQAFSSGVRMSCCESAMLKLEKKGENRASQKDRGKGY